MKRTFISAVILTALLAIVSCSKSFDAKEEMKSSESQVFSASIEDNDTKTTLNGKSIEWSSTDKIAIIDNSGSGNCGVYVATPKTDEPTKATFSFESGTEASTKDYVAYYPSTLCWNGSAQTNPTLPAEQVYNGTDLSSVNPMYAYSTSKSLSFKNICGILKITATGKTVNKIVVSSDQVMTGTFTVDNNNDYAVTMKDEATSDNKKVTLTGCSSCTDGVYYVAIPPQTYENLVIKLETTSGNEYMVVKTSPTIARNKLYSVTFRDDSAKPFTVASGKTVYFSKGNLYWTGSAWQFETNQYDYPTSWNTSHVGHFFWTNLNDYQSGTATYMPYAGSFNYSSRTVSDKFFCGADNKLSVNGSATVWYALIKDEWSYLISTRTVNGGTGEGKSYQRATINSDATRVYGLIIYPDGYTSQITGSSCTTSEWTTMESAGCVFLPAAGYRTGSSFSNVGSRGTYWSSTPESVKGAYYLYFNSSSVNPASDYERSRGGSLRLVRDIE